MQNITALPNIAKYGAQFHSHWSTTLSTSKQCTVSTVLENGEHVIRKVWAWTDLHGVTSK